MNRNNDSREKIIASLVMGFNCVNSLIPIFMDINIEHTKGTVVEPKQYTAACYQALDMVDTAIFSTAEATFTEKVGSDFATTSVTGETIEKSGTISVQTIFSGGTATNSFIYSGGIQNISSGGTAMATSMISGGTQVIYEGAAGTIINMSGGSQAIFGGTGTVNTILFFGYQDIYSGGTGTADIITNYGRQTISAGGTGIASTLTNYGEQCVQSGGTGIASIIMNKGEQHIKSSGTGITTTLKNGWQTISAGGVGIIDTIASANNGTQTILSGGTGTVKELNGGSQTVNCGGTSLNTHVNGGTMVINTETDIPDGDDDVFVKNTTLDSGSILLDGKEGNFRLYGDFTARGGTVDLRGFGVDEIGNPLPSSYETLTIDKLIGNGTTFLMHTDLNSETKGDKVIILDAAPNAGGFIQVYDKSLENGNTVPPEKKLLLITDKSGITTWKSKSLDTGGLWIVTPTIEKKGKDWYLVMGAKPITPPDPIIPPDPIDPIIPPDPIVPPDPIIPPPPTLPYISPNPAAKTLLGFSNANYGTWRTAVTDDTLRIHLGDLRYNDAAKGIWARIKTGKLAAKDFVGSYQLYQVGIDKKLANTVYGIAVDHITGKNNYDAGKGKNSIINLNFYSTNYHPSGVYTNAIVKAGKYCSDLNIYSTNDATDYSVWGYSASYELGKTITKGNGFFLEPEMQLVLGKLQGAHYTSNKKINAHSKGMFSLLGRLGFIMGRRLTNASDYYFKASMWREFAASGEIKLSATNNFGYRETLLENVNHKDTWVELGLGGNVKLAKNTHLYGDVVKTFGGDINKKWQVNAGVRWEF